MAIPLHDQTSSFATAGDVELDRAEDAILDDGQPRVGQQRFVLRRAIRGGDRRQVRRGSVYAFGGALDDGGDISVINAAMPRDASPDANDVGPLMIVRAADENVIDLGQLRADR